MTTRTALTFIVAACAALTACRSEKSPSDDAKASPTTPVKPSPAATNTSAPAATTAAQAPTQAPAPAAQGGHTAVPTTAEWAAVGEVNVKNSTSLGCETKMIREWLRVSCSTKVNSNPPKSINVVRPAGDKEFFTFTTSDLMSLVMPVRPGVDAEVKFVWRGSGARTLRVTWPAGAPAATMGFDRGA